MEYYVLEKTQITHCRDQTMIFLWLERCWMLPFSWYTRENTMPWMNVAINIHQQGIFSTGRITVASQITGVSIVWPTDGSDADQRKHQSSASLAFVREIHRWPVNSPYKGLVTRKLFPFDDIVMFSDDMITVSNNERHYMYVCSPSLAEIVCTCDK